MTPDTLPSPSHPSDEDLAAYLARVLPAGERSRLEAHVERCVDCRAVLAHAGPIVAQLPAERARRRFPRVIWGGLAAAGLAGLILARPGTAPDPVAAPSAQPAIREGAQDHSGVQVVAPPPGARTAAGALRFTWRAPRAAEMYEVSLSAADGTTLWSTRLPDTTVDVPGEVVRLLKPGARYFWRVDALLSDLRSVTSDEQSFEVAAP